MRTTEDEAKTKWCPFVQIALDAAGSRYATNRGEVIAKGEPINLNCIGSHCNVWRETTKEVRIDDSDIPVARRKFKTEVTGGYCGLAKTP